MKKAGLLFLAAVFLVASGVPAQAAWFSKKEEKSKQPASAMKKDEKPTQAAPAAKKEPAPAAQPVASSLAAPAAGTAKPAFMDMTPEGEAVYDTEARKEAGPRAAAPGGIQTEGEAEKLSEEETEQLREEMLRLKQGIDSAQGAKAVANVSAAVPPRIPEKVPSAASAGAPAKSASSAKAASSASGSSSWKSY